MYLEAFAACRQRHGDFPMSTKVVCITYGAPKVGSLDLQKAVQSSGWHKNFVHAVTRHDMVPRIFIAMREGDNLLQRSSSLKCLQQDMISSTYNRRCY